MRVAFQGTRGSFSEAAARRLWPDLEPVPCREAVDVVAAVRQRTADAGCLPIENSLVGSVAMTYDLLEDAFGDHTLQLTNEVQYPIHHALLGLPGASLAGVRRVLSHPVALGQCRRWLSRHLPAAELVGAWDTAGSAELVARDRDPSAAAIAARHAADIYALIPLADCIEDDPTNQTRFLIFVRPDRRADMDAPAPRGTRHKTSLVLVLEHQPGALARVLDALGRRGVNLTSLHSRPEHSAPWTYRFYVDVEGTRTDPDLAAALDEIAGLATKLTVLGSYRASGASDD